MILISSYNFARAYPSYYSTLYLFFFFATLNVILSFYLSKFIGISSSSLLLFAV